MGRGKRRAAAGGLVVNATRSFDVAANIPLSAHIRTRVVPLIKDRGYLGDFTRVPTRVVGLHVHKTWGLARKIAEEKWEMEVERDRDNAHDTNAVACYLPARKDKERVLLGYIDSEEAEEIAAALDEGARLHVLATQDAPEAGQGSKGGSLYVKVFVEGEE